MYLTPHFQRSEFACNCGCGFDTIDHATLTILESVRVHYARPVVVNSGARCHKWNRACGGAANSQHLRGRAVDFTVDGVLPSAVADYLEKTYPGKFGVGRYRTFTHFDTRSAMWRGGIT